MELLAPLLAVVLLLVAAGPGLATEQPNPGNLSDGELLQAFKATFANGEQVLRSWVGLEPCDGGAPGIGSSWLGVQCATLQGSLTDRVTVLLLNDKQLQGTIPPEAGNVLPSTLLYFSVEKNNIQGPIPPSWRLPPGLIALNIQHNPIGGTIPPDWDLPDGLQQLYLNANELVGSIPPDWRLPASLETLALSSNRLSGSIPWTSWEDTRLQALGLEYNLLTGALPERLPSRLMFLRLTGNRLSGPFPPGWSLPLGLQRLLLAENQLVGGLDQLVLPRGLQQLEVWSNQLTGTLPAWPGRPDITIAATPGNAFCGEVPTSPRYVDKGTEAQISSLPSCTAATSGDSNIGAIVGGAVGGAALVAALAALLWWWLLRQKCHCRKPQADLKDGTTSAREDGAPPESTGAGGRGPGPTTSARGTWSKQKPILDDPLLAEVIRRLQNSSGLESQQQQQQLFTSNGAPYGSHHSSERSSKSCRCNSGRGAPPRELGVDVSKYIIPFSELHFIRPIGHGSAGRVYLCTWRGTNVAAKVLLGPANVTASVSEAADMVVSQLGYVESKLQREAALMAALRHPNVLSLIGLTLSPPCLVEDYCPRGSLHAVLAEARKDGSMLAARLTWTLRLNLALGAAKGMLYLHTFVPPIVHRDLKSPNILLTADWQVKVADFNMSKIMGEGSRSISTSAVTNPVWLAPEVLQGESHTLASDVYSFALILYELLTWTQPWAKITNPWQISAAVVGGARPEIPDPGQLPGGGFAGLDAYLALIRICWAQQPEERPGFSQIIAELRGLLGLASAAKSRARSEVRTASSPASRDSSLAASDLSQGTGPPIGWPSGSSSAELGQRQQQQRRERHCEVPKVGKQALSPFAALAHKSEVSLPPPQNGAEWQSACGGQTAAEFF